MKGEYWFAHGQLHGLALFDDAGQEVASIHFLDGTSGISVRSTTYFEDYGRMWYYNGELPYGSLNCTSGKKNEFGNYLPTYERTYVSRALRGFALESLRSTAVQLFGFDPGPAPEAPPEKVSG